MVICLSYPARQRGDLDTEALKACDQGVFGEEGGWRDFYNVDGVATNWRVCIVLRLATNAIYGYRRVG